MFTGDIRPRIRDFLAEFVDWLGDVTVLEWVLLGLALAAVLYVVARVRAATRIGPIEVAPMEDGGAGEDEAQMRARTARLRERIDEVGLRPPPDVPSGAPQGNVLSAIEDSPIPQANWIASLIAAFPRPEPVSYKLMTTLLPDSMVAFRLCPSGAGAPLLDTVTLTDLPRVVLSHVAEGNGDIFPPWAQWSDDRALQFYLMGLRLTGTPDHDLVAELFEGAARLEPESSIARLRWLNARELCASRVTAATDPPLALQRAVVLRGYLDLVMLRPELVEARFRASALAGVLADALRALGDDHERAALEAALDMDGNVEGKLRTIDKLGIRQAFALVQPWFVPLVWHRPRYAAEPQGDERRRLRRTLRISKCCELARRYRAEVKPAPWLWTQLLWARLIVSVHADRSATDWQVYYNAACFFALLEEEKPAFRFLNRALDSGGYHQLRVWRRRDPDLKYLRVEHTERWRDLVGRTPTGVNRRPRWWPREFWAILAVPVTAAVFVAVVVALVAIPWGVIAAGGVFVLYSGWNVGRYLVRARKLFKVQARTG